MWTPAIDLIRPKGVMKLRNNDEYCLPRALVTAIAGQTRLLDKASTGPLYDDYKIMKDGGRQQKNRAKELSNMAGVTVANVGCGLEEIKSFQNYLRNQGMAIIVYSAEKDNSAKLYPILFNGTEQVVEIYGSVGITLRILYYPQVKHFEYIYAVKGLQSARHYCEQCSVKYKNQYSHKNCPYSCIKCYAKGTCDTTQRKITFAECHWFFYGQQCYNNHLVKGSYGGKEQTVCDNEQFCLTCHKIIFPIKTPHSCGKFLCSRCKELCEEGHFCFMTPVKLPPPTKQCVKFVYYDFETRQDDKFHGSEKMNIHVPNLCVAQQVCNVCCDIDDLELSTTRPWCNNCGVCETIFHGEDCVEKFVDYVLEISKPKTCKKVVCIAHNAKGFDAQFILTELFNRQLSDIDTIMTGTSVTLIELNNRKIKFIDSLNFISAPLSALPKSFGFEDKMRKGYFPHFFNSRANQYYIGVMPDKQFYGFNSMSEKSTPPKKSEKQEFLEWYENRVNTNNNFNFKEEILHYCKLDVSILRLACSKFRKLILDCGYVCPFTECTTIASTCMLFYRRNYLKEKQIGILPRSGYRLADNQSRVAIEWLTWLEHSQNIKIINALRGREIIISGGIKLDGYREAEDGQKFAYQFHGCFWHGCPKCFKSNRSQPTFNNKKINHSSHNMRYEKTQIQSQKIESGKYNLIEIWECEFNNEKKTILICRPFSRLLKLFVFSHLTLEMHFLADAQVMRKHTMIMVKILKKSSMWTYVPYIHGS
ncbi:GSCOCG00012572001-RA-CDS [Cotesia congregata]|nr:GSCOCG00012572001-RA-CDS [Cotesia congregata]